MATLSDIIKATSGLIAYWPMISNNQDQSGNDRHLTSSGSVSYISAALNSEIMPSASNLVDDGIVKINQATLPKIVALECWFRIPGSTSQNSCVFGANAPPTAPPIGLSCFITGVLIRSFAPFRRLPPQACPRSTCLKRHTRISLKAPTI